MLGNLTDIIALENVFIKNAMRFGDTSIFYTSSPPPRNTYHNSSNLIETVNIHANSCMFLSFWFLSFWFLLLGFSAIYYIPAFKPHPQKLIVVTILGLPIFSNCREQQKRGWEDLPVCINMHLSIQKRLLRPLYQLRNPLRVPL